MFRIFLHILLITGLGHSLKAQEVLATDGDYASNALGSLSWTLGEVITETFTSVDGDFTQGFQQNYEDILAIDELGFASAITLFPNPFLQEINITFSEVLPDYRLTITDYQSKTILETVVYFPPGSNQVSLDLSSLSSGYYLVQVLSSQFQIIRPIIKTN